MRQGLRKRDSIRVKPLVPAPTFEVYEIHLKQNDETILQSIQFLLCARAARNIGQLGVFKIKVQRFDCFSAFSKRCESNAVIG